MTPHLHPRSRLTTSLFGTTLLVSFLVVGMPHIVPCPAPRVKFADSDFEIMEDGRRKRRRRTTEDFIDESSEADREKQIPLHISEEEKVMMRKKAHECPVPKPPGIIGRVLGLKSEDSGEEQSRPRVVTQKIPTKATTIREDES